MKFPLTRGYFAVIDDTDAKRLSKFTWHVSLHGGKPYARTNVAREGGGFRTETMHRIVYGEAPPGLVIDHINGNGLDNRRENLRPVTQKENSRNRQGPNRNSRSRIRGVYRRPGRWVAQIRVDGRLIDLGSFPTADLAKAARRQAERAHFGSVA